MQVCYSDDADFAEALIIAGADVNFSSLTPTGLITAWSIASENGRIRVMKALIEGGLRLRYAFQHLNYSGNAEQTSLAISFGAESGFWISYLERYPAMDR